MDIEEAIYNRRTIRRFKQEPVPIEILKKLIDFARVAPMGSNIQSIEYIIVSDSSMREKLFPLVQWAGFLPEKDQHPEVGRRPMVYIIVLGNTDIKENPRLDAGAAIENILLAAVKFGLGSCWMGSVNREKAAVLFNLPKNYEIISVISLGYPDEKSSIELFEGSFKYWKDEDGIMHVPKRQLNDVIFKIY